ncbi:MAG: virulence RhuM family protein [Selenomonadaceae bacterium]|nr:virulence RhuM family protein [Selenomonadaceae bacterium]
MLTSGGREILTHAGKVSHDEAMKKAESEYRKFQVQNLSPVEKAYLETIKAVEQTAMKKSREKK